MGVADEAGAIDRLIHLERRIDAEVRQRFARDVLAGRTLDPAERRAVMALMADLQRLIADLGRASDRTRDALASARANTSASLAYLGARRTGPTPRRAYRI